jgi:hypothetical protein
MSTTYYLDGQEAPKERAETLLHGWHFVTVAHDGTKKPLDATWVGSPWGVAVSPQQRASAGAPSEGAATEDTPMISIILLVLAAICHLLASFGVPSRVGFSELGWALATLAVACLWGGLR